MPSWAFTPAAKWCFGWVISVTRSAAARSSGLALRPVTTTWRAGRRAVRVATTRGGVEVVVAERDVELVEDDEAEGGVGEEGAGLVPAALGGGDVAAEVLGLPGEALAHGVPGDAVAEGGEGVALAGAPGALDELDDADAAVVAEHAEGEAEGGGATCPCRGRS